MSNRNEILGISYSTACNQLRKNLLFDLAGRLNLLVCYRCNESILAPRELSIDHKKAWLEFESSDLFWDLDNLAFSHLSCNSGASRRTTGFTGKVSTLRKSIVDDKLFCSKCETQKDVIHFTKNKNRWTGYEHYCKECRASYRNK